MNIPPKAGSFRNGSFLSIYRALGGSPSSGYCFQQILPAQSIPKTLFLYPDLSNAMVHGCLMILFLKIVPGRQGSNIHSRKCPG